MSAQLLLLPHPFTPAGRRVLQLPAGRRLADELAGDPAGWAVWINGRPVRAEVLAELELADGDLATARPVPGDPATIGLVVAALAKAAAVYFGATATTSAIIGTVAGAAASFAAARLLVPDVSKQASAPASQPFYSVNGSRNQTRPFGVVPAHYGSLRVVPDLLMPIVDSVSDSGQQTLRALFCVGDGRYSGIDATSDSIRLGTQRVSTLGVADFEVYSGLEDSNPPSTRLRRFVSNIFEELLGLELRHVAVTGSPEQIRTTAEDALSFDVQLVFPNGIWRISDSGHQQDAKVRLLVQYRAVGATDWLPVLDEIVFGFIPQKFARNVHFDPAGAGQYEVRVKLEAAMNAGLYTEDRGGGGGSSALTGDAVWTSLRSYILGEAILDDQTDGVTMFGLSLGASELVTGTLDQITVKPQRMLPTWSEADGWSDVALGDRNPAAFTATQNPAWAFANEMRDGGVPDDEIDAAAIKEWADFCTLKGWALNYQQTDEQTLEDVLHTIASAGQAFPAMRGALRSVVWEAPRDPVAAFGPWNSRDLVSTQSPIERVDAMRVRFVNTEDVDGRLDERTIYFGGYSESTAEVYRTADVLNGLTDPVLVERYLRLERLKAERRSTVHKWQADWSAAVVEVGDVVLLLGAGALRGAAESECTGYSVRDAGAHLDELFCDPAVRIEAGRTYHARVRTRAVGDSGGFRILALPLENPLTAGVQMLSALPIDGDFAPPTYEDDDEVEQTDDLVAQPLFVGEPDEGEVMVTEVAFDEAGSCSLTGVDFARSIFDEVLLETPHDPQVDPQALANTAPAVPVLAVPPVAVLTGYSGTGYGYHANFEYHLKLAPPAAFPTIGHYRAQYRYHLAGGGVSNWFDLPDVPAPAELVTIGPLARILLLDLRLWAISAAGAPSEPLYLDDSVLR